MKKVCGKCSAFQGWRENHNRIKTQYVIISLLKCVCLSFRACGEGGREGRNDMFIALLWFICRLFSKKIH